ncbi:MAG: hypothetical protein WA776_11090 [Xanthobacteraceae bacterium]
MAKLFVRIAGALGVTTLAVCFLGLIPVLSAAPSGGAGDVPSTPGFTVNRALKGDRLPMHEALNASAWQTEFRSVARASVPRDIPVGCDPAFSPVASPRLAFVYGRCLS